MLHYSIVQLQKTCGDYGGIVHPNNAEKCCASTCGKFCGATNCNIGPGGAGACCGSGITAGKICGVSEQMAPCHLGKS